MADNPATVADFYISPKEHDSSQLVYSTSGTSEVHRSSASSHPSSSHLPAVATSPDLDISTDTELPSFRRRSQSLPCVLYKQVALELRGISDDFNKEYSRNEWPAPAAAVSTAAHQQGRRMSLPDVGRQSQHRVQPPGWFHSVLQSLRQATTTQPRSHNNSISEVPEEDMEEEMEPVATESQGTRAMPTV